MKNYTPYLGNQYGPPPYSFPGVTITSFVLQASASKLQDYCDNYLNNIAKYHFGAIGSFVILGINEYPKLISEPVQNRGYVSQNEYFFMFPVVRTSLSWTNLLPGFQTAPEITWVFPYIGVDNATSAFCGRELLGFEKSIGRFEIDIDKQKRFSAIVEMPGFQTTSAQEAQQLLPLLEIQTSVPQPAQAGFSFPWDLWTHGTNQPLDAITPDEYSVTNLKQFCDPADPKSAVYQALVRMVFRLENQQPTTFYDGATILLTDNISMSVADSLGLAPNLDGALHSLASSRMTADMRLDGVSTL
jgi:hypothetical protein